MLHPDAQDSNYSSRLPYSSLTVKRQMMDDGDCNILASTPTTLSPFDIRALETFDYSSLTLPSDSDQAQFPAFPDLGNLLSFDDNETDVLMNDLKLPPCDNPPSSPCDSPPMSEHGSHSSVMAPTLIPMSRIDRETHEESVRIQKQLMDGKATAENYQRPLDSYERFIAQTNHEHATSDDLDWEPLSVHPITPGKVALFLAHESTRNKVLFSSHISEHLFLNQDTSVDVMVPRSRTLLWAPLLSP